MVKKIIKKILIKLKIYSVPQQKEIKSNIDKINKGENVRFMGENVIDAVNPQLISIGNNCVIGVRSSILTHCPIRGGLKVSIGNYVWLGFGVYILPDAKIGNNTIVGAASIVTKKFPDNVILVGNPARVLRTLTNDEIKHLQYRLKNKIPMGKV